MENLYKTEEYKGYNIKICFDDNAESPREWDNFGKMLCFHSRYNLGDEKLHELINDKYGCKYKNLPDYIESKQEFIDLITKEQNIKLIFPLYLYDHSGISISMGNAFTGIDAQGWDTSAIGFIYATKADIAKEFGKGKKAYDSAKKLLESEVKTYNDYLTGQVYGFQIEDSEENKIESCYGYFGNDSIKEMIIECKSTIDYTIKETKAKQKYEAKLICNEDTLVY